MVAVKSNLASYVYMQVGSNQIMLSVSFRANLWNYGKNIINLPIPMCASFHEEFPNK